MFARKRHARTKKCAGVSEQLTIVDKLHETRRCADADANLFVLEQSDLFLDFHVFCKLSEKKMKD